MKLFHLFEFLCVLMLSGLAGLVFLFAWYYLNLALDRVIEWAARRRAEKMIHCDVRAFDEACEIEELERWAEMPDLRTRIDKLQPKT